MKLILLTAAENFCGQNQIRHRLKCLQAFCGLYKLRRFELVPEWVALARPDISWQTLTRWQDQLKKNGVTAMAAKYGQRRGRNAIDTNPKLREMVEAFLLDSPHLGAKQIYRYLQVRWEGELPGLQILQRWIRSYKENPETASKLAWATNPDRWRNQFEPALGSRSERAKHLNALWELDSTISDAVWELADGKRYAVLGCIDVYSRRARLLVAQTSNSDAIAALLRRCLLDWGAPTAIKTDNGKDYTSIYIDGLIRSLECERELCTPFTPTEKPHIERFLGTFNHSFIEYLSGYCGHSVAERQAIRARELFKTAPEGRSLRVVSVASTLSEFQAFCDQWVDWYMLQPHQGLGGKRPIDMLAVQTVKTVNERALDVLLMKAPDRDGKRIVQKKGVQVGRLEDGKTAWFIGAWIGNPGIIGSKVYVRLDPADLGTVYVFRDPLAREFLGTAQCAELVEIDRQEIAMRAKHKARKVRQLVTERKRLARKLGKAIHEDILESASATSAKVITFPGQREEHRSAALEAAEMLLRDQAPREAEAPLTSAELERLQSVIAEPEAFETAIERFNRLRGLEPSQVSPEDYDWMRYWLNSYEARHVLAMNREFYPHLQEYLDAPKQANG